MRLLPLAALLIGLTATAAATIAMRNVEAAAQQVRFDRVADELASRLGERLNQHLAMLQSTEGLVRGLGTLHRPQLQAYLSGLDLAGTYRGIQGLGLAEAMTVGAEAAAAARIKQEYGLGVAIRPPTDQTDRALITLLEPSDRRNLSALGYDMFSEPVRRAAMMAALQTGRAHASGPVQLVQEITSERQVGFLVFIPTTALDRSGGQGALKGVRGFVYAAFRAGDLHHAVLDPVRYRGVAVRTIDLGDPDMALYESDAPALPGGMKVARTIDVAGRRWRLTFSETPDFASGALHVGSWTVALLALLLTAALTWIVHLSQTALAKARRSAAETAQLAEQRSLMAREMAHRIKNHLARIQAIARHTRREVKTLDEFDHRFSDRLRAMAAAQDMLTDSGPQGAPIAELILRELAQVMPREQAQRLVSGPKLVLTGRQALAVALVTHELATNAMKYGTLSQAVPALSVSWQVDAQPEGGRTLQLDWREPATGTLPPQPAANAAPPSPGFGTQLIEAMVVGDLSGSFTRTIGAHGLHAVIRFPLGA